MDEVLSKLLSWEMKSIANTFGCDDVGWMGCDVVLVLVLGCDLG